MSEKVLLTGISGFIAKHVAIELLNSGYEVLGTVRDINSIEITKKTLDENNASTEKLSFVELDLLKDDGWDKAAEGCKYIIHVASPFPLKVSNDRESLTPAAKDGTLRVLNAGINAKVEHIVKTSSIVCMYRKPNRTNPYTFGENDWTDLEWDKTTDYFVSKTRAERAAWELMESKGIKNKLTCINPGFVLGDFLNEKSCTSMEYIKQLLQGKYPAAPKFSVMISHVKDIAKAHVLSLNNKKAEGRRLIVGSGTRSILELSKIMTENIPSHSKKLPKKELPNFMVKLISYLDSSAKNLVPDLGLKMQTDTKYAEEILQMKFIEPEVSVVDAAKSVIRLNLA